MTAKHHARERTSSRALCRGPRGVLIVVSGWVWGKGREGKYNSKWPCEIHSVLLMFFCQTAFRSAFGRILISWSKDSGDLPMCICLIVTKLSQNHVLSSHALQLHFQLSSFCLSAQSLLQALQNPKRVFFNEAPLTPSHRSLAVC